MGTYYEAAGNLYFECDGKVRPVGIKAKDKVVTHRELLSTTVVLGDSEVILPPGAVQTTVDRMIEKRAVSERHPLVFDQAAHDVATAEKEAQETPTDEAESLSLQHDDPESSGDKSSPEDGGPDGSAVAENASADADETTADPGSIAASADTPGENKE